MVETRVSYHDSVEEMLPRIREDGMSNAFDRYAQQEKIRCKFCLQGLSCLAESAKKADKTREYAE